MASSSTGVGLSTIGHPVTEKLSKSNFALWKVQVLPAIRGAQLMGYIDGTIVAPPRLIDGGKDEKEKVLNPEYSGWLAQDQQVQLPGLFPVTRRSRTGGHRCHRA